MSQQNNELVDEMQMAATGSLDVIPEAIGATNDVDQDDLLVHVNQCCEQGYHVEAYVSTELALAYAAMRFNGINIAYCVDQMEFHDIYNIRGRYSEVLMQMNELIGIAEPYELKRLSPAKGILDYSKVFENYLVDSVEFISVHTDVESASDLVNLLYFVKTAIKMCPRLISILIPLHSVRHANPAIQAYCEDVCQLATVRHIEFSFNSYDQYKRNLIIFDTGFLFYCDIGLNLCEPLKEELAPELDDNFKERACVDARIIFKKFHANRGALA